MRTYTEKELETLIKEVDYFKDLNDKLEADNKELTKQLALCSVSDRRKQLIKFFDMVRPVVNNMADKKTEDIVDYYLSKI